MSRKKKKWKVKIRRDEGELFTITEHTRVCSLHFTGDDYGTTLGGLKVLKDDAVPSVFPWKTPVNQRLSKTRRKLHAVIARRKIVRLSV